MVACCNGCFAFGILCVILGLLLTFGGHSSSRWTVVRMVKRSMNVTRKVTINFSPGMQCFHEESSSLSNPLVKHKGRDSATQMQHRLGLVSTYLSIFYENTSSCLVLQNEQYQSHQKLLGKLKNNTSLDPTTDEKKRWDRLGLADDSACRLNGNPIYSIEGHQYDQRTATKSICDFSNTITRFLAVLALFLTFLQLCLLILSALLFSRFQYRLASQTTHCAKVVGVCIATILTFALLFWSNYSKMYMDIRPKTEDGKDERYHITKAYGVGFYCILAALPIAILVTVASARMFRRYSDLYQNELIWLAHKPLDYPPFYGIYNT